MLRYLHVKNLALIKDAELYPDDHLNILSGETGAGKSILLGSIHLAMGGRGDTDAIRSGESEASVELIFSDIDEKTAEKLKKFDVSPEDGELIISRKITREKSIGKVNGEAVTAGNLRKIAACLLDVYGQRDHDSLLEEGHQLSVYDAYLHQEIDGPKAAYRQLYSAYREKKETFMSYGGNESETARKIDLLTYELEEIEDAKIRPGEEAELLAENRRLRNAAFIEENLEKCAAALEDAGSRGIAEALKALQEGGRFDPDLLALSKELLEAEAVIGDVRSSVRERLSENGSDEERLSAVEERLSLLKTLKRKYGNSEEEILKAYEEKSAALKKLQDFLSHKNELSEELNRLRHELIEASGTLHQIRVLGKERFTEELIASLRDLNFLEVRFEADIRETNRYSPDGADEVTFLISVNPGEPLKPLSSVASGGELSRLMLAIRTMIAESDDIHTMIFDEIDAGISGKTAAAVGEKMQEIAKTHQVLCISHLPQIVAMADHHFLIEKNVIENAAVTSISELAEAETVQEIARLSGTGELSEAALQSAFELRNRMKHKE